MKKEELIQKLLALPDGIEVCIYDHNKNAWNATGEPEGNSEGIYSEFDVDVIPKDFLPDGKEPFAMLVFTNDDYEDGGIIADMLDK